MKEAVLIAPSDIDKTNTTRIKTDFTLRAFGILLLESLWTNNEKK
jgi:hypothetical protein